jgi:hypothetical protein
MGTSPRLSGKHGCSNPYGKTADKRAAVDRGQYPWGMTHGQQGEPPFEKNYNPALQMPYMSSASAPLPRQRMTIDENKGIGGKKLPFLQAEQ